MNRDSSRPRERPRETVVRRQISFLSAMRDSQRRSHFRNTDTLSTGNLDASGTTGNAADRLTSTRAIGDLLVERQTRFIVESLVIGIMLAEPRRRHRGGRTRTSRPADERLHGASAV